MIGHRHHTRHPDRATITREVETGTNQRGHPITETLTVAEGVRCVFEPAGTEFIRTDSGDRVQRPATVTFETDVDVQEGDDITIKDIPDQFEARGVRRVRDHRRGRVSGVEVEVERA